MRDKKEYLEYQKLYYQTHKEKLKEYSEQYRQEHKEHYKEYDKQYNLKHSENKKQWYLDHKKQYKQWNKQYRLDHPEQIKQYSKQYRQTPEGKATRQREKTKRRANEKEIINTLTTQEWEDILKKYKFRCAYCGKEFTLFDRETKDHIIPISKGGDNTKENIVLACRSCNSKKGNKILK